MRKDLWCYTFIYGHGSIHYRHEGTSANTHSPAYLSSKSKATSLDFSLLVRTPTPITFFVLFAKRGWRKNEVFSMQINQSLAFFSELPFPRLGSSHSKPQWPINKVIQHSCSQPTSPTYAFSFTLLYKKIENYHILRQWHWLACDFWT